MFRKTYMKHPVLLTLAFFSALALPSVLFAAEPPSVTGISAEAGQDGSIKVRWTAVQGGIVSYRVYYSQKSILENNGYYDDVETTTGPVTEYVLRSVPASLQTVYVAVMAVNTLGEESGFFIEETHVTRSVTSVPSTPAVSSKPATVSSPPPAATSQPTGGTLHLLSAQALSATRVGLLFSAVPVIDPTQAPTAFGIVDSQGTPLAIEQMTIDDKTVTIQTVRQTANFVYQVRLSEPLKGEGDLPLDSLDRTTFFTGHQTGLSPQEAQASSITMQTPPPAGTPQQQQTVQAGSLPDVLNFRLEASPQVNRLFTIIGQWEYDPATPEGTFVVIRQSRDGGRSFGAPEYLPRDIDGVRIPDVTPENFGLAVYVVDAGGRFSTGLFRSVFGWNTPVIAQPQVAAAVTPAAVSSQKSSQAASSTIAPSTPKAKRLTQTGAGAMLGLAALGAFVGWRKSRKTKEEKV